MNRNLKSLSNSLNSGDDIVGREGYGYGVFVGCAYTHQLG